MCKKFRKVINKNLANIASQLAGFPVHAKEISGRGTSETQIVTSLDAPKPQSFCEAFSLRKWKRKENLESRAEELSRTKTSPTQPLEGRKKTPFIVRAGARFTSAFFHSLFHLAGWGRGVLLPRGFTQEERVKEMCGLSVLLHHDENLSLIHI